ncbi:phage protease [Variovorax sp. VNK109]|uniref:phage protease n=1 Tax=Variovorax sp. VNK109 TaxID=3400919 RepID=UPI003C014784
MKHTAIALLAAALTLQANADVHLVPAGEFSGRDGRPQETKSWKLTDDQGRALAARLNARHVKTQFQFDYEHQTMLAEQNGQPAPASGWAQRFEWRDGDGLYAVGVQWTERALQMLKSGEYRYISPVLVYHKKTGEVLDVLNASLVGIPNLLELNPAAQERVARLNAFFTQQESDTMNPILKALLAGLGLADAATEAEATTALSALKAKADQVEGLQAKVTTAETEVAQLKAKSTSEPDPTKYVSIDKFNTLNTEVTSLKAKDSQREVDSLIEQAKNDGKLTPAAESVWRDVGKADIAQLKALIEKTPANPALAGQSQTGGKNPPEQGEQTVADLTTAANKYIAEQAALGIQVDSAQAVNHVMKQQQKAA